MGSPWPTLAYIFMGYIEVNIIPDVKNKVFYLGFLDDCFVLVRSDKSMNDVFNIFWTMTINLSVS